MNIAEIVIGDQGVTVRDLVAVLASLPQDYIVLKEDDTLTHPVTGLQIWHDNKEVLIT